MRSLTRSLRKPMVQSEGTSTRIREELVRMTSARLMVSTAQTIPSISKDDTLVRDGCIAVFHLRKAHVSSKSNARAAVPTLGGATGKAEDLRESAEKPARANQLIWCRLSVEQNVR